MNLTSRMNLFSRSLVPALALASASVLHAVPANDNVASSTALTAGPAVTASNADATLEPGEALPPGFTAANYAGSVWWHWKPDFSGWYQITTEGSEVDTVLSVWTSTGDKLSLVHSNGTAIQFKADNSTEYRISVAGRGTTGLGALSLRLFYTPDPFANVVASRFEQTAVDITNGDVNSRATLTIEASREIAEGTFTVIAPDGVPVANVPFSAANRVSGFVARGVYEVSFSLPQHIAAGSYAWSLSVASASNVGKLASQGRGALTPADTGSDSTLAVVNNGVVDGYALWVAGNGGGSLASLIGGTESFGGNLSLDKYAFGLTPDAGGGSVRTGPPAISTQSAPGGAKHLRVEYTRRKDSAQQGLGYRVQFSDDLVQWVDAATDGQTLASDATFEAVAVEDTVSATESPRRFARVLVERVVP